MENLLKLSMLQGSSGCEPVPGLGAGSRACSCSADLCPAGKEQWWTLETAVASWKRHQATVFLSSISEPHWIGKKATKT